MGSGICRWEVKTETMNNEYIIVNKTAIQKRIEELEKERLLELKDDFYDTFYQGKIAALKQILSQSTPLIPVIEQAFDEGFNSEEEVYKGNPTGKIIGKQDYISNLKLDI